MGLELWAPEGHRLPQLTTVVVPDGADDTAVAAHPAVPIRGSRSAAEWDRGPAGCGGSACMGHTARPRNVTLLLAALAETLGRLSAGTPG